VGADGATIDEIVVGDAPEAWSDAGFTVDDDGTSRVGAVRLRFVGPDDGRYVRAWSLRGVDAEALRETAAIDGIPTTPSDRPPCRPAAHENGVTHIDHVVVLSPDITRTIGALGRLDIEPRRTRDVGPEQYGFPARQTFFRLGDVVLELIGPADRAAEGADRPARVYGLAFTVDDIDALARRSGPSIGRVKDAVQPGRRITTLRHKQLGLSVAVAFMSR
jgi:hypothetical protein